MYNINVFLIIVSGQEARYIVDTGERQYIQINEAPMVVQETITETCDKDITKAKDEDKFWDRNKVKLLLTLCLENKFKNGTKDKSIWNEIAVHLGSTSDECIREYRNLRRTYIRLLKKKKLGKEIKWVHFSTCEELFKLLPASVEPWEEHKVRRLLTLYIDNLARFRSSDCLQKDVWKEIAAQLNTTEYNCYHKFKNLKRAYLNWKERSRETGKPMKWQYQHYFERIFYNYNPSIGPWNKNKTRLLIDAYMQIADKFKNPRYQKKELWKEIAASVGEQAADCDKKFRNLKQTYIRLKMRANSGRCVTQWRYFKDFETIYGGATGYASIDQVTSQQHTFKCQELDYVKQLLSFYVENKEKFNDPLVKKKHVWRLLAPKIGLSTEECDRKFRNLKQTYLRLAEKKKETGKSNNWPYYSYFEKIYDEPLAPGNTCNHNINLDNITMSEIKRVVQEVQHRKDNDKFEILVRSVEESNMIQRERNRILQALLDKK